MAKWLNGYMVFNHLAIKPSNHLTIKHNVTIYPTRSIIEIYFLCEAQFNSVSSVLSFIFAEKVE